MKLFQITRHKLIGLLLFLALSGYGPPGWADLEVNGLIIDQTRTRVGQEIYRQFSTRWGEVRTAFPFNITVRELPDARWGSLLIFDVNGKSVYRNTIRPRGDRTEEEAQKAVASLRNFLLYLIRTNGENQEEGDLKGDGF